MEAGKCFQKTFAHVLHVTSSNLTDGTEWKGVFVNRLGVHIIVYHWKTVIQLFVFSEPTYPFAPFRFVGCKYTFASCSVSMSMENYQRC